MDPVPGATVLVGDFMDDAMPDQLRDLLGGLADLVLSDMAPNTTGHNATDHLRIMGLADLALHFAVQVLVPGGAFVAKVFQGGSEADDAGADEAALRGGAPRQATGQPEGVERALRCGDGVQGQPCGGRCAVAAVEFCPLSIRERAGGEGG